MKAAVCYEFDQPLVVEDLHIDPPQAGEVKIRIAACAICHSDIHLLKGEWGEEPPLVAGHEAAGVVTEVGPGVTSVQAGEHVIVTLIRSCGHCQFCTIGRPFNCAGDFPLNHESRLRNGHGEAIAQGIKTGAFAEFAIVDQSQVAKIPEAMPFDSASLLACGVITGLGSVTRTAQVKSGNSVAVIGTGGVGLNAIQGAVLSGATPIIAIDVLDSKLEAARRFGATDTIDASSTDVVAAVRSLSDGFGVEYAFATVGSQEAIIQATRMVRKGGTTVIVGMPSSDKALFTINAHSITEGRTVIGSNMGSTRLLVDIPRLIELYGQGRLKLDELISQRYPLEEINEAIASVLRGEALRNVIVFD